MVDWTTQLSGNSELCSAIDKSLVGQGVDGKLFQFVKVACSCVMPTPNERPTMFEAFQLRAIRENYHFTAEDEMVVPSETGDVDDPEELIVARDIEKI